MMGVCKLRRQTSSNNQVDRPDVSGCTALYLASKYGHAAVAALLLEAGADPDRTKTCNLNHDVRVCISIHRTIYKLRSGEAEGAGRVTLADRQRQKQK